MYTGFRTTGNLNAYGGRNKYSVSLGKIRNTVGSINRPYNYCARTSSDPLYCLFQFQYVPPISCYNYQQGSLWPFYRGINYNGLSKFKGPLTNTVKWRTHDNGLNLKSTIGSSPVIDKNGNIYICYTDDNNTKGGLYSIKSNGTLNWSYDLLDIDTEYSNPAIGSDGTIYFTSTVGMYAINPDGSKKWNNTIGNGNDASIVIDCHGTIYTGTRSHGFFAINPSDGSVKWNILPDKMNNVNLNGWCFSINNDTIYCGSNNGLFAINLQGQILWYSAPVGICTYSTPAFDKNDNIYIGSATGLQYVSKTGTIIETIPNDDCSDCSPTIDKNGNIYIGTDSGFYVYDSNRNFIYSITGNFNFISPVIDNNEYIYIYNLADNTINCINIKINFLVWFYEIGSYIYSTPAIGANEVLYISYFDGFDYGIVAIGN